MSASPTKVYPYSMLPYLENIFVGRIKDFEMDRSS